MSAPFSFTTFFLAPKGAFFDDKNPVFRDTIFSLFFDCQKND